MREHYSTIGTDEARGIGARLVSRTRDRNAKWLINCLIHLTRASDARVMTGATYESCLRYRGAGEGIRTLDVNLGKVILLVPSVSVACRKWS